MTLLVFLELGRLQPRAEQWTSLENVLSGSLGLRSSKIGPQGRGSWPWCQDIHRSLSTRVDQGDMVLPPIATPGSHIQTYWPPSCSSKKPSFSISENFHLLFSPFGRFPLDVLMASQLACSAIEISSQLSFAQRGLSSYLTMTILSNMTSPNHYLNIISS